LAPLILENSLATFIMEVPNPTNVSEIENLGKLKWL
jgi:hypothetical protein